MINKFISSNDTSKKKQSVRWQLCLTCNKSKNNFRLLGQQRGIYHFVIDLEKREYIVVRYIRIGYVISNRRCFLGENANLTDILHEVECPYKIRVSSIDEQRYRMRDDQFAAQTRQDNTYLCERDIERINEFPDFIRQLAKELLYLLWQHTHGDSKVESEYVNRIVLTIHRYVEVFGDIQLIEIVKSAGKYFEVFLYSPDGDAIVSLPSGEIMTSISISVCNSESGWKFFIGGSKPECSIVSTEPEPEISLSVSVSVSVPVSVSEYEPVFGSISGIVSSSSSIPELMPEEKGSESQSKFSTPSISPNFFEARRRFNEEDQYNRRLSNRSSLYGSNPNPVKTGSDTESEPDLNHDQESIPTGRVH